MPRPRPLAPPYPFPGGRRRHADFALENVPEEFGDYVEPFLGGGAVAIALMERYAATSFRLSSDDPELIVTWQVLQSDVDALVRLVGAHRERHDRAHRAAVLAQDGGAQGSGALGSGAQDGGALAALSPVERAARFVYLQGSAPDREAVVFDESNVRGVARLLQNRDVTFTVQHFFGIVASVRDEDLVYFAPPFEAVGGGDGAGAEAAADAALVKEARSLVNTLTARGAYLLAPESPAYAGWKTLSIVADRGDGDEVLRANGTLARILRAQRAIG